MRREFVRQALVDDDDDARGASRYPAGSVAAVARRRIERERALGLAPMRAPQAVEVPRGPVGAAVRRHRSLADCDAYVHRGNEHNDRGGYAERNVRGGYAERVAAAVRAQIAVSVDADYDNNHNHTHDDDDDRTDQRMAARTAGRMATTRRMRSALAVPASLMTDALPAALAAQLYALADVAAVRSLLAEVDAAVAPMRTEGLLRARETAAIVAEAAVGAVREAARLEARDADLVRATGAAPPSPRATQPRSRTDISAAAAAGSASASAYRAGRARALRRLTEEARRRSAEQRAYEEDLMRPPDLLLTPSDTGVRFGCRTVRRQAGPRPRDPADEGLLPYRYAGDARPGRRLLPRPAPDADPASLPSIDRSTLPGMLGAERWPFGYRDA